MNIEELAKELQEVYNKNYPYKAYWLAVATYVQTLIRQEAVKAFDIKLPEKHEDDLSSQELGRDAIMKMRGWNNAIDACYEAIKQHEAQVIKLKNV